MRRSVRGSTDDLSFLLARANALSLAAGNAALAQHGLRARSYSVLALAAGDARPSQRELAELLRLDPSQVVALVDDLQRRGLVAASPIRTTGGRTSSSPRMPAASSTRGRSRPRPRPSGRCTAPSMPGSARS